MAQQHFLQAHANYPGVFNASIQGNSGNSRTQPFAPSGMLVMQPVSFFPPGGITGVCGQFGDDDEDLLVDTLAQTAERCDELEALQKLAGCNGHSYEQWRDYWLSHSRRLKKMVSERAQIRGSTKAVWIKTEKGVRQRSPSVVIVESTPRDKFSFEDAKALVNALAHRRGENSLKDVFEGLAGHNGHSYAQWVDFYLTHAKELNGMMPDSANAKQAGSQDGDKHGENSSVVRVVRPKRPLTPHPSAGPSRHSQRRRLGSPDEDDAGTASSEISVPLSGQRQLALTAPKNLSSNSHRKADSDSDDGSSEWEDDEESKSRLGKNYSDAEKEALARHVASIPRNSRLMKWGKLERAFSTRTASAWGKYYRSHVREVEDHIESLGLIRPDTGPYLTSTG